MLTRAQIHRSIWRHGAKAVYAAAKSYDSKPLAAVGLPARTFGDRQRASLEAWLALMERKAD